MGNNTVVSPIKTFEEFEDYVTDVCWCPNNSSVFSTVDASGNLDLFNLHSSEISISRASTASGKGLNKVGWSPNGDYLATGCLDGQIEVFDMSKFK